VLKNVVPKEMTRAAKERLFAPTEEEKAEGIGRIASAVGAAAPEVTDCMNESPFTPLLRSLIGEFDPPHATHVGIINSGMGPLNIPRDQMETAFGDFGNLNGHPEEGFPYYNAIVHMDGLTGGVTPKRFVPEEEMSDQEIYWRYVGKQGRNADNIGSNGGVLFQDRECTLSTGSFTLFAVLCLNDQTEPGCGQFTVLRGSHHAMEKFVRALSPKPLRCIRAS